MTGRMKEANTKDQSDLWHSDAEMDDGLTGGQLKMAEQPFMVRRRK